MHYTGLTSVYREEAEVKTFVGMIDELDFLPLDRVSDGKDFLRGNSPPPSSSPAFLMALVSCSITLTKSNRKSYPSSVSSPPTRIAASDVERASEKLCES